MPISKPFAFWASAVLALVAVQPQAMGQTYPDKTIRLIVGFPAGQASDTTARTIATKMAEILNNLSLAGQRGQHKSAALPV